MKTRRIITIAIIILLAMTYILTFNMKASTLSNADLIEFSKTGFVEASTLSDTAKLVASNASFDLLIDETTSYFKVIDKVSGEIWESNPSVKDPWELDPNNTITNSALAKQKSTLEVAYFNKTGSLTTVNNYTLSISHPASILNAEGERTFQIKYIDQGVQVLYEIKDMEIDYLYFPKYMPKDTLEALEDFEILSTLAYTGFDEDLQAYEITQYVGMSKLVKRRLYSIFYEKLDYTRDRAISENELYGYTEQYEKVAFEIAIQIKLTNQGIEAAIINQSIVEPSNVKIARISLLPLFGTAVSSIGGIETEGYIVLPDGSGAVIEFNNGKYYQNAYRKRLYGEDTAILSYSMPEQQQKINIPLFGMVKENGGYAAIITKGDAMAAINADVSGRIDSYNKAYVTFSVRESEAITIGSGYNQYGLDLWTRKKVKSDFTVEFVFLNGANNNYVGIAKTYQAYLIDQKGFTAHDSSNQTVLTTEFIGAYDRKEFFLGIPYYSVDSMTTFDESEKIINELLSMNIDNINVLYTGIMNGGISSSIQDRVKIERVLGGKKGYADLEDYLLLHQIPLYTNVDFASATSYNRLFDQFRYTANRIQGSNSMLFEYHIPSGLPYSETTYEHSNDDYIINPLFYTPIYQRFAKDYSYDNIAFTMLGSMLGGNYNRNQLIYKQDAIRLQEALFEQIDYQMMFSNPLGFAIPYSNYVTDLPTEATLYSIIDYQIPLLQLVLSGMIDYSSQSINISNDRSVDYQFLKLIETGSNIKYTLTYDNSQELLNTEYNYYMTTHYVNWLSTIKEQVDELDMLGIHDGYLVNHVRLSNNVYEVTYSHGLKIIINYNLSAVTAKGHLIPGTGYYVSEVA